MARVFREKKSDGKRRLILFIIAAVVIVFAVWYTVSSLESTQRSENLNVNKEAIIKASAECYSLEGRFPPSLEYLEKNYGVVLDKDKYIYDYKPIGENIMPRIEVFPADNG